MSASAGRQRASRSTAMNSAAPSASSARVSPPETGPNLDDRRAFQRPRRTGDAGRQIKIAQKILAKSLAGVEPVARDHFAQRRQSVDHDEIRPARRTASTRLEASATPLPAMSKAVP